VKGTRTSGRRDDIPVIPGDYQYRAAHAHNPVQRFWHRAKKTAIAELCPPAPGDVALDVGCGSGVIAHFLSETYGARVVGIDANMAAVSFARTLAPDAQFVHGCMDDAFTIDLKADRIYCLELIEHLELPQVEALLRRCHALLADDGRLFLTTPNYRSLWPLIEWTMDRLRLAPPLRGDQHVTFFHARSLSRVLEASGFAVERLTSNCFVAPWMAAVSWWGAEWLDRAERRLPWPLGSVLIAVAVKR